MVNCPMSARRRACQQPGQELHLARSAPRSLGEEDRLALRRYTARNSLPAQVGVCFGVLGHRDGVGRRTCGLESESRQ